MDCQGLSVVIPLSEKISFIELIFEIEEEFGVIVSDDDPC